ncbi:sigma-70 family RNA polymerase sigma factor [Halobacillus litoralis]|uniref:RNA polymerase sigma-70 region 4 domain-containing protein n=1 Tax=Halobacillus litoralis TaxID=45668 RepID=A0A410MJD6_9BACI|nr:sigma-70 family RNA polymerase sigma factor [Halobacillus litoralis]QAS54847.1 hypothetical protein HLI_21590 [Halobacillus litoralis]
MFKEYNNYFSIEDQRLLLQFIKGHQELLENPLVISFLEKRENLTLLVQHLRSPSKQNKQALDEAFREYYTGVKILNYLSKTLYWEAVNFDKKKRKENIRFPLVVDGAASEEDSGYEESLVSEEESVENQIIESSRSFLIDRIGDIRLKTAFSSLTQRQKQLLEGVYGDNLTITETADKLGITQQGASKIHKLAIERLKKGMSKDK